jgi:Sec-independent protein translocase protein TatA
MFDDLLHLAFIGPGGPEFLLIMLVLLMMFGAKDAPRILRKLNEIISQIRNTADGFKREVMYGDLSSDTPSYEDEDYNEDEHCDDGYDEDDELQSEPYVAEEEDNVDATPSSRYSTKQERDETESHDGDLHDGPEPESADSLDEEDDAGKT